MNELTATLFDWLERDQAMRREAPDARRWQAFDAASTGFLRRVIERWGWPGPSLVGEQAATAAFILAQHSPDLAFQEQVLSILNSLGAEEILPAWAAYLEDRICIRKGEAQLYGTQIGPGGTPFAIQGEWEVDTRRASVGLEPLAEYLRNFRP